MKKKSVNLIHYRHHMRTVRNRKLHPPRPPSLPFLTASVGDARDFTSAAAAAAADFTLGGGGGEQFRSREENGIVADALIFSKPRHRRMG